MGGLTPLYVAFSQAVFPPYSLGRSSQMAPPDARGPLEVLVGPFTDFSDFLGRLLVVVEFHSRDYLFTYMFFFQESSPGEIASSTV